MKRYPFTEQELLDDLDAKTAHADELAEPLPQELTPLKKLNEACRPPTSVFDH